MDSDERTWEKNASKARQTYIERPGRAMKLVSFLLIIVIAVGSVDLAFAQSAADEKLSTKCNAIYVKLCHGFKPSPEMLGKCYEKRPSIAARVPKECTENFQTNIENYNDAKAH